MYEQVAGLLGRSTTYSSELESIGALLLGSAWGGVHAADTLPAPASTLTCRVVNTASTDDGARMQLDSIVMSNRGRTGGPTHRGR